MFPLLTNQDQLDPRLSTRREQPDPRPHTLDRGVRGTGSEGLATRTGRGLKATIPATYDRRRRGPLPFGGSARDDATAAAAPGSVSAAGAVGSVVASAEISASRASGTRARNDHRGDRPVCAAPGHAAVKVELLGLGVGRDVDARRAKISDDHWATLSPPILPGPHRPAGPGSRPRLEGGSPASIRGCTR
jgi:hypothetical protein